MNRVLHPFRARRDRRNLAAAQVFIAELRKIQRIGLKITSDGSGVAQVIADEIRRNNGNVQ